MRQHSKKKKKMFMVYEKHKLLSTEIEYIILNVK